ncbi:MAG: HAD family hydrolase [Lachnospiraceae bacterium]|nr:HAD family hydrolase [Lachnospiraceae bacterium]
MKAIWFDIGGTIHTQKATPENDVIFTEKLMKLLEEKEIHHGMTGEELLKQIDKGSKTYKKHVEAELIELPGEVIWTDFFLEPVRNEEDREKIRAISEELSYLFDRHRKVITRREGLVETLEALKQMGYRLGVISNIMSRTFVPRVLEEYGIREYFEELVLSSECGIRKPNPKIFDIALEKTGLTKEECCYVGDTVSRDIIGTRRAGWNMMIQIDNPLTYKKDEHLRQEGWAPDHQIFRLEEIPSILKKSKEN